MLTSYDGNTITYDTIGNPLTDGTWTYTWQNGRELASMTDGATTWTYTYDANGLRKTRSNGTDTYTYVYNGSQLVQMTRGTDVLYFDHATGTVTWNGVTYYYVYNLQGDVIAILDSAGTAVVNYVYDAWGNLVDTSGYTTHPLGTLNPLTYRGYVYDFETGLYYLQSRYYNPEIGRFLNADAYASTGQGILGNNMFAYCGNNPVNRADPTGHAFMQMRFDTDGVSGMLTPGPWGGGSGGGGPLTERPKTSGALREGEDHIWGSTRHAKILPWEFDILSASNEGLTLIDASVSLNEVSLEWDHLSVTLLRSFCAEASAGITKEDGLHAGVMASMVSADITISFWAFEAQFIGYVGAIGIKAGLNTNGFSAGYAAAGLGGEFCVTWDIE